MACCTVLSGFHFNVGPSGAAKSTIRVRVRQNQSSC